MARHEFTASDTARRSAVHAGLAAWAVALLGGCQTPDVDRDYEPVVANFHIEVPAQTPDAQSVMLPLSGVSIPVAPRPVFIEGDIANVELVRVDLGLCLLFEFTPDASRALLHVSGANLGRRLVVSLNGRPFGARMIDSVIPDGRLLTFVEMPDEELSIAAVNLKKTSREIQEAVAKGRGQGR